MNRKNNKNTKFIKKNLIEVPKSALSALSGVTMRRIEEAFWILRKYQAQYGIQWKLSEYSWSSCVLSYANMKIKLNENICNKFLTDFHEDMTLITMDARRNKFCIYGILNKKKKVSLLWMVCERRNTHL